MMIRHPQALGPRALGGRWSNEDEQQRAAAGTSKRQWRRGAEWDPMRRALTRCMDHPTSRRSRVRTPSDIRRATRQAVEVLGVVTRPSVSLLVPRLSVTGCYHRPGFDAHHLAWAAGRAAVHGGSTTFASWGRVWREGQTGVCSELPLAWARPIHVPDWPCFL